MATHSSWKTLAKRYKKTIMPTAVIIIIGSFLGLLFLGVKHEEILKERDSITADRSEYVSKRYECIDKAYTSSSAINNAGLTDCGGKLASESVHFASLSDIYHSYCYSGFGSAVYGCAYPETKKIYICLPGTTLYDRRNTYVSRYFISYQYISYACDDKDIGNTIRHELLHLVYAKLSASEQKRIIAKLEPYRSMYISQLSPYSSSERDGELFVRVGADGRQVDDIELVDLYSQVSFAYVSQKKEYYGSLINAADKYLEKYNKMSSEYTILRVLMSIILIADISLLVYLFKNRKSKKKSKKNTASEDKPKDKPSTSDEEYYSSEDDDI